MNYLEVPYSSSIVLAGQYSDGIEITRQILLDMVLNNIKCVALTQDEIRAGMYTESDDVYILFCTKFSTSKVRAIYYNSNGALFSLIGDVEIWTDGTSTWKYNSIKITDYVTANNFNFVNIFESLSSCFSAMVGESDNRTIYVTVEYTRNDTNEQGGISDVGGGNGTFDDTSDVITIPSMPALSAHNSGLITIFRPTLAQVQALGRYLWTNLDDFIDNFKKFFSNPMDYFISFSIVPCIPDVTALRSVKLGLWDTGIEMPPVTSQWFEFDCGTVEIPLYWGSALDYAPNTKITLFLPFIGSVQINTDEVMGQSVSIKYRIDLLSGQCVAIVSVNNTALYQFTGECSVSVPLTGSDWSRIYSAAIGAIGTVAAGAAGVGAALSMGSSAGIMAAQSYNAAANAGQSFASIAQNARGLKGAPAMRQAMFDTAIHAIVNADNASRISGNRSTGIMAMRLTGAINNTVSQVMSGKSNILHSGTITGASSLLGIRKPYFVIEFPNQSLADNYKHFVGYPSNIYSKLDSVSGYTEVEKVLINIEGTDDELAEIIEALHGGVYL